eukprot:m.237727 g.237727  ORF g.237727 m.237727 type:complete len:119 (-) comp18958_c1_seq12:1027-1383(-)
MTWTWGQTLLAHAVVACCVPAAGKPTQTLRDTQALPPNFLIGAMKSGTSFLHARLLEHSHCVKATRLPGEPSYAYKELHFFNTKRDKAVLAPLAGTSVCKVSDRRRHTQLPSHPRSAG